jgi:hypothetical protein
VRPKIPLLLIVNYLTVILHESVCIPLILFAVMTASLPAWAVITPSTTDTMLSVLLVRNVNYSISQLDNTSNGMTKSPPSPVQK